VSVMDCSSLSNSSVSDRLRCGAMLWRDMAALLRGVVSLVLLLATQLHLRSTLAPTRTR
jgi:hypothetical protein